MAAKPAAAARSAFCARCFNQGVPIQMQRFTDWPERFVAYIAARQEKRFDWGHGRQDCCSFAAGSVLEITGIDLMADIPPYTSAEEADLILADTSLEALMDMRLHRHESPAFAQRGDVGLSAINGNPTLMIVEGATIIGPGPRRLERLPRHLLTAAWAV